ncbi:MAG: hypothetical protein AAGA85_15225 [Bacteroidota bacterium]
MKAYLLSLLVLLAIATGCSDDPKPDAQVVGVWQLTEILADPGDGSGTFQPTSIDKTVTFFDDATVATTQSFCAYGADDFASGVARYSEAEGTIEPDCPAVPGLLLPYFMAGDELVISYLCIEPCAEKYRKVRFLD